MTLEILYQQLNIRKLRRNEIEQKSLERNGLMYEDEFQELIILKIEILFIENQIKAMNYGRNY